MNSKPPNPFVVLAVLDGWGIAPPSTGNAITTAKTPNMSRFWLSYPHTQLGASGDSVGLPRGEVGNTETGHLNLGAGRIVYQDLARINMAIADGSFFQKQALVDACNHVLTHNSGLHVMGLTGASGVHSNIEHLFALIQMAAQRKIQNVYLHLFTDGRDSPPTAALTYITQVKEVIQKEKVGVIASIMGRYWAMDRDRRWDRTQRAYQALTQGVGNKITNVEDAIAASYKDGKTDEFVEPSVVCDTSGNPIGLVKKNDAVIFFNFRIDRPRQLAQAFVMEDFSKASETIDFDPHAVNYTSKHDTKPVGASPVFERGAKIENLCFVTMTEYSKVIGENGARVAFPPEVVSLCLGRVVSDHGLVQLRAAESEKERFVTFYFNGQQEAVFPGEERLITPSPKVATYDLEPQMSARQMTLNIIEKLRVNNNYSFVLINFANVDMVGHTGNFKSAVQACEVVDECLAKLEDYVNAKGGVLIITADHGNAEEMLKKQTGDVDTEHSSNPVPFIAVSSAYLGKPQMLQSGILADVAPTILSLLSLPYSPNDARKKLAIYPLNGILATISMNFANIFPLL